MAERTERNTVMTRSPHNKNGNCKPSRTGGMERNSNVASAHLSRKKATTSAATSESIYDYHDGDDKETLSAADARAEETSTSAADRVRNSSVLPADDPNAGRSMNPLLRQQLAFLGTLTAQERESFFSSELDPDRRGKIWTRQADLGERLVNTYAWATPDDRALAILRHFSPLIEIGCGARAYWCSQMDRAGIDVVGFDQDPTLGGKIDKESASKATLRVRQGGPEVLARPEFSSRNLFLCYPDENDDAAGESGAEEDDPQHPSLAYQCLQHFRGDYVIHVGEIFSDTVLAVDQAPWGRSSSPEFQQLLASEFHCLLRIGLPSWVHVRDTLTVWKRSEKCPIVFGGEDEGDTDECVYYRHIPAQERLPTDVTAPCLAHLLNATTVDSSPAKPSNRPTSEKKRSKRSRGEPAEKCSSGPSRDEAEYSTPW